MENDRDRLALTEIEITPEMISAGIGAFWTYADETLGAEPEVLLASLASEVYAAMALVSRG